MNLKTVKYLDIQDNSIPKDVKDNFFEWTQGISNDVCIKYKIEEFGGLMPPKLEDWILENTDAKVGDIVIVSHWW